MLLGANGAGKTTLMRALNGLEKADGEILFEGEPVSSGGDRLRLRRQTAAVFQQAYLLATTVRGNVESGLRIRGVRRRRAAAAGRRRRSRCSASTHLADRRRTGLSGGEAQRVSIARALAVDPAVVFLDEPMAVARPADAARPARRPRGHLPRAAHRGAVGHARHGEALAVADRITFLADGRLVQDGTPDDLLVSPATKAVADYLGVDSWLEGEVRDDGGRLVFRTEQGGELVVQDSPPGPALVCIRPDDVLIFREQPDGGALRNLLPVKVSGVRPVGRHWRISLRWGEDELDAVIDHDTHSGLGMRLGDQVWALVDAPLEALPREATREAPAAGA